MLLNTFSYFKSSSQELKDLNFSLLNLLFFLLGYFFFLSLLILEMNRLSIRDLKVLLYKFINIDLCKKVATSRLGNEQLLRILRLPNILQHKKRSFFSKIIKFPLKGNFRHLIS